MDSISRLDRVLSERGYASRSELKALLSGRSRQEDAPRVLVQGRDPKGPEEKVRASDVTWNGEPLDAPRLYIMLHKPEGLTCSHDDKGDLVYDLLPPRYMGRNPKPACVGRLDKDTTGLILITDDGQALHRWTSPKHKVPKTYLVHLEHPVTSESLEILRTGGLMLEGDDRPLLPSEVEILGQNLIKLTLYEGRYHQIKRTFFALDNNVGALHRSHFGPLNLDGLAEGQYRDLTPAELALIL